MIIILYICNVPSQVRSTIVLKANIRSCSPTTTTLPALKKSALTSTMMFLGGRWRCITDILVTITLIRVVIVLHGRNFVAGTLLGTLPGTTPKRKVSSSYSLFPGRSSRRIATIRSYHSKEDEQSCSCNQHCVVLTRSSSSHIVDAVIIQERGRFVRNVHILWSGNGIVAGSDHGDVVDNERRRSKIEMICGWVLIEEVVVVVSCFSNFNGGILLRLRGARGCICNKDISRFRKRAYVVY